MLSGMSPSTSGVDTASLLPELTRQLDLFSALAEVGKALTGNLVFDDVMSAVGRSLTQLLKPSDWSVLLVDEQRHDLYFAVAEGAAGPSIMGMRLQIGEGIAGWVAARKEGVVVPKVADDPRFCPRMDSASSFHTSSILCAPLVCRGELLGVIELVKGAGDNIPYTREHLEILTPFADFAAVAIDNARTFERVQQLTITDEWTGLYNARFLRRFLEEELWRARRYHHELSVMFFDLDHFKLVNDTHGHATGSALLRHVAGIVRGIIRDTDRGVRYGGDEFVVVMPETPKPGALVLANRLRGAVSNAAAVNDVPDVAVTASFGVATYPSDASEAADLLALADQAMYDAKRRGRDGVSDAASLAYT